MSSRLALVLLCSLVCAPAWAQDPGPGRHPIEFGVSLGHLDFDDEIRFENDVAYGIVARAGFFPWLSLGVDLSQMTMRDARRGAWSQAVTFAIHFEGDVRPRARWSPTVAAGVSFMGFEETEQTDAISEGLDLGFGVRGSPSSRWSLRAAVLLRMQTFRLVDVAPTGEPLDRSEDTGFLWSRVLRVELTHVF